MIDDRPRVLVGMVCGPENGAASLNVGGACETVTLLVSDLPPLLAKPGNPATGLMKFGSNDLREPTVFQLLNLGPYLP